ncbi:hypothetical protein MRB53_010367 [Persea americana]|uniref:Uncharacterized protein n=1 Tax=Persea americana TaxID=3435 RepID=A0ACC2LRU7_PERAE|nr:hypothetical protein MRB53_010367 [Persea americana]
MSPSCRRKIEFAEEEQNLAATGVSSSFPSSITTFVQNESISVESDPPVNVKPQSEVLVDKEILPPSPLPVVQLGVEETSRVEMSSPAPITSERLKGVSIAEESTSTSAVLGASGGSFSRRASSRCTGKAGFDYNKCLCRC